MLCEQLVGYYAKAISVKRRSLHVQAREYLRRASPPDQTGKGQGVSIVQLAPFPGRS